MKGVKHLIADETQVHKNINIISYNKRHIPRANKLFSREEQLANIERFPGAEKQRTLRLRFENGVSEEEEAFAEARLSDVVDRMEETLAGSDWLAGDSFSLADIAIAPFMERFEANGVEALTDFTKRPRVGDWWSRVQARDGYKTAYAFENPNA